MCVSVSGTDDTGMYDVSYHVYVTFIQCLVICLPHYMYGMCYFIYGSRLYLNTYITFYTSPREQHVPISHHVYTTFYISPREQHVSISQHVHTPTKKELYNFYLSQSKLFRKAAEAETPRHMAPRHTPWYSTVP